MSISKIWHTSTSRNKYVGSVKHRYAEKETRKTISRREGFSNKLCWNKSTQGQVIQGHEQQMWQMWSQSIRFLGKLK